MDGAEYAVLAYSVAFHWPLAFQRMHTVYLPTQSTTLRGGSRIFQGGGSILGLQAKKKGGGGPDPLDPPPPPGSAHDLVGILREEEHFRETDRSTSSRSSMRLGNETRFVSMAFDNQKLSTKSFYRPQVTMLMDTLYRLAVFEQQT